jgi:hypothetical protein
MCFKLSTLLKSIAKILVPNFLECDDVSQRPPKDLHWNANWMCEYKFNSNFAQFVKLGKPIFSECVFTLWNLGLDYICNLMEMDCYFTYGLNWAIYLVDGFYNLIMVCWIIIIN